MERIHHLAFRHLIFVVLGTVVAANNGRLEGAIAWGPPYEGGTNYKVVFDKLEEYNPVYEFQNDPQYGDMTVSFGTHFVGQTLGNSYNSLSQSSPLGPLTLAAGLPDVVTQLDLRMPGTIRLGGVNGLARYTTPIALLFSDPVSQVGFTLGFLDELPPSTMIEAFEKTGASLGVLSGLSDGYSTLSVVESTGDRISGVSIYLPDGNLDEEGFGIDAVTFSTGGMVPEPATLVIWSLLGLAAFSAAWYSSRPRG